ncbi:hypothetical protein P3602_21280 [Vibrio parahaemolyticus]|uniref:hypothetical protein n=1 Tax=Vibrio TaxID=662 RepID=UPI001CDCF537|nr:MULTISPECIES: hypothetical protein [Vibrio]MDF5108443.1 hypothetical protein [Vibrio parahaemolyticus]MCA2420891.1 hypothetical protein [Vibrio alginolyticus]MCA2445665.1 hypothetical protein [Vibrio alginolyticus]MDF5143348.1 hypothetical protein [Vibrio parahaemolyticus]MDF5153774.1 hypothetical protein [Vibrio parahaemolyticus]
MRLRGVSKALVGTLAALTFSNAMADPLLDQAERLAQQEAAKGKLSAKALVGGMSDLDVKTALQNFNKLHWTQILPVNDLIMVENDKGEKLLMDSKARIAIRGNVEVYDMWNKRPINTQADAKAAWMVTLDRFGVHTGDLASFRYGLKKDKPDVTLLVDPSGDFNVKLFDQMKAMADKYSFEIVLAPLLGGESINESLKLWCAKDRQKSLDELMAQKSATGEIFPTCNKDPLIKALGVAGVLQIKGLPYLIRADGLQLQGTPDSLSEFMSRNVDNIGEVIVNDVKASK